MLKQALAIILMGLFTFLFSCKENKIETQHTQNPNTTELVDITSRIDPAENWSDIFLKINEVTKTESSHIFIAKGLYKGKTVGLKIEVSSSIGAGIVDGKPDAEAGFVTNAVRFHSLGEESDALLKAIAELYNQPINKGFTKTPIPATVFSLNEKPVDLNQNSYYKLKLFFEENDEELYSEVYLNINTEEREIEIHEKDEEYREALIKVWSN